MDQTEIVTATKAANLALVHLQSENRDHIRAAAQRPLGSLGPASLQRILGRKIYSTSMEHRRKIS
jgi:hypothetical protein